jgi:hypothetical protein
MRNGISEFKFSSKDSSKLVNQSQEEITRLSKITQKNKKNGFFCCQIFITKKI